MLLPGPGTHSGCALCHLSALWRERVCDSSLEGPGICSAHLFNECSPVILCLGGWRQAFEATSNVGVSTLKGPREDQEIHNLGRTSLGDWSLGSSLLHMLKLRKLGDHQGQKAPKKATGKRGLKKMDREGGSESVLSTRKAACWVTLLCSAILRASEDFLSSPWGQPPPIPWSQQPWYLTGTGMQIMFSGVQGQSDSAKREISFFQRTHSGLKEQFLPSETTCHSLKQFTCFSRSGHPFKE